jgi:hypothetical protein
MWSLTSWLAKMREWAAVPGENLTIDGDLKFEMAGSENVTHLEKQPKSAVEKLVYGMMLKACLQTMEAERNHIHTQLFEVNKIKQGLTFHIKILHTELVSLQ